MTHAPSSLQATGEPAQTLEARNLRRRPALVVLAGGNKWMLDPKSLREVAQLPCPEEFADQDRAPDKIDIRGHLLPVTFLAPLLRAHFVPPGKEGRLIVVHGRWGDAAVVVEGVLGMTELPETAESELISADLLLENLQAGETENLL